MSAERGPFQYKECFLTSVALQEELDWRAYSLFGLIDDSLVCSPDQLESLPGVSPGERTFEIQMARQIEAGTTVTRWFERGERKLTTAVPEGWPSFYKTLVARRLEAVLRDRSLTLVESPNCKRRWELEAYDSLKTRALRNWLLARIEKDVSGVDGLLSLSTLADRLRDDSALRRVAELYTGRDDADLFKLISELVLLQDVPYLSVFRYKDTGLRKREQWERTWDLQRREDEGEDVGTIPVPPKYGSGDFQKTHYWSLRGKLDVPKERFISYPLAERESDTSPVIGWAGWNHAQQAQALASYFIERKEEDGWTAERLTPLLAGLLELLPWLKQWHNEIDPDMDSGLGDFYEGFIEEQCRLLHLTQQDLRDWRPPTKTVKGGRKKKA